MSKQMQQPIETSHYLEMGLIACFQAENQIYEGLKTMVRESSSKELSHIFQDHRVETEQQIKRLKKIAEILGINLEKSAVEEKEGFLDKGKEILKTLLMHDPHAVNETMAWLISQGKKVLGYLGDNEKTSDIALSAGARLIEEFEVGAYKVLCALAKKLDHPEVLKLLQESLKEEQHAFDKLGKYVDKAVEHLSV